MKVRTAGLMMAALLPAAAEAQQSPYSLGGMVVTGTRQDSSLRDLAGNTAVVGGKEIEFIQPQRPAELLNQVPGVGIQQGSGEEHLTAIRSPVLTGGAGAGSFLYLEDGVPLRAAGFGNVNGLFETNIEQAGSVEVVRGPGSALYGSNAVHGLINVIPRKPAKDFGGDFDLSLAPYAGRRLMASLTGSDVRLSALASHEGGWRDHTRLDEQKFVLRQSWSGNADTVTTTLSGQSLDQDTGGYVTGSNAYRNRELSKRNANPEAFRQARSVRGATRWQHDLSDSLQLSLTPYARYTEMQLLMHFVPSKAREENAHSSVGVQSALYKALPGGHSVILGTDLEYTRGWLTEIQANPTTAGTYVQGTHYDYEVNALVAAPYVHSEWQVMEKTRATLGLRVEGTFYDYENKTNSGIFGRYLRPANRSDDFTTITPKFGLVQQWWEDKLSTYLNLSRGARAPQVTDLYRLERLQKEGDLKPESLDSIELGTRGTLEGVQFDMTAFWMYKKHFAYRDADGNNVTDGETRHKGVELALASPLPWNFDIGAGATYARHLYAFDRPQSSGNATESVRRGNKVDTAPDVLGNLRLGYTFFAGVRAEMEWVHVGPYFADAANLHKYEGHDLFNLRAAAKLNESVSLHAKLLNLANTAYADRADYDNVNKYDRYFPGQGRTVMGGATVRF